MRILYVLIALIILAIAIPIFSIYIINREPVAKSEACGKVTIGMSKSDVLAIMKEPKSRPENYFFYGSIIPSSCDIYIKFSPELIDQPKVIEKFCDDGNPPCEG